MRTRPRWWALALAMGAVALASSPAPPAVADHDLWPEPAILPCTAAMPEMAAERPGADVTPFTIDLLVVVDRVPEPFDVQAIVERAAGIYAEINLPVSATFEHRDFVGRDTAGLMEQLQESLAGLGAERYDAVLLETGVDITNPTGGSIAGYANCLGGVRYRRQLQSFAVAEVGYGARSMPNSPVHLQLERDAMVAAHEIGHLFGARHEHGTCVEGLSSEDLAPGDGFLRPCTLMGEKFSLGEPRFGTLETAVIRGHARHYAAP